MFGETAIFYVMIWNHPVETAIKNWLFLEFQTGCQSPPKGGLSQAPTLQSHPEKTKCLGSLKTSQTSFFCCNQKNKHPAIFPCKILSSPTFPPVYKQTSIVFFCFWLASSKKSLCHLLSKRGQTFADGGFERSTHSDFEGRRWER